MRLKLQMRPILSATVSVSLAKWSHFGKNGTENGNGTNSAGSLIGSIGEMVSLGKK
jgi:hypothetical protein